MVFIYISTMVNTPKMQNERDIKREIQVGGERGKEGDKKGAYACEKNTHLHSGSSSQKKWRFSN